MKKLTVTLASAVAASTRAACSSTPTPSATRGCADTLSYESVSNGYYRFTWLDGAATNTATVLGTNAVLLGGRSFDWGTIPQTPTVTTNIVTTAVTNVYPVLKSRSVITNTIADVTCSGGKAFTNMTEGVYIVGGDRISVDGLRVSGEATRATLIIEK